MDDERKAPWRSPIAWPPQNWRFNVAQQLVADAAVAGLVLGLLITGAAALTALFVIPYQAIVAVFSAQHEAARNYLLALGALLGVPFLIWRTKIAARQTAISQESLYTQLTTSGIERLGAEKTSKILEKKPIFHKTGSEWSRDSSGNLVQEKDHDGNFIFEIKTHERTDINIEVRLGAVYALERVALDSTRDRRPIMKTLAAYVRNSAKVGSTEPLSDITLRPDVQAALNVVGQFPSLSETEFTYDLSKIDFRNIVIRNASFESCDFSDSISNRMYFKDSSLRHSGLSSVIWKTFSGNSCVLDNLNIIDSQMERLNLTDSTCNSSEIYDVKAPNLTLRRVSLSNSNFIDFIAPKSNIIDCIFKNHDFTGSSLSKSKFKNTNFSNSSFNDTDLSFCNFNNTPLLHCEIKGCNITGIKSDTPLIIDLNQNFSAASEWIDERLKEGVAGEIIEIEIEQQWREWLRDRRRARKRPKPAPQS